MIKHIVWAFKAYGRCVKPRRISRSDIRIFVIATVMFALGVTLWEYWL